MKSSRQSPLAPMGPATLTGLCDLVKQRSGLVYTVDSQSLLEKRLEARVLDNAISSYADYLSLLRRDAQELSYLYELLTTKETYFFRQEYQLRAFVDEVLPLIASEGSDAGRLTIWSAGCSSGEETYTLAMLLSESRLLSGWKIRILGTDLCASNIEHANRGVYRTSSFRSTTEEQRERFFTPVEGGWSVRKELRRMVHFSVGNLMEHGDARRVGRVDIIFCRNVLIYFDEEARRGVTELFFERLLPGGYLFLGHSESLLNTRTQFEPVHLDGDLVYKRPILERSSQSKMRVFP